MTMTDAERRQLLRDLQLDEDGDSLAQAVMEATTSTPKAPTHTPTQTGVRFAPEGVDPHTMPVSDIVFTDDMVDGFPDLSGDNFAQASRHLWTIYKSPKGQRERNQLLHRRITEFLHQVNRHRRTGGLVRELVKADAPTRELARFLAARNLTVEDLTALIQSPAGEARA